MKIDQVAAQLYTVRDSIQTAKDFGKSMERLQKIGFRSVQISGAGPIREEDMARMLKDNGLKCCATHAPGKKILEEPQAVIEQLETLGCKHVAYPYPAEVTFETLDDVKRLAEKLDEAGKVFRKAKKILSYHNHSIEFRRIDGKPILEWLYNLTDEKNLQAELDTYWVQHGGGSPEWWCKEMEDRLPCLHMKDYAVGKDNQPQFAEIGNGNLNWKKIVNAAEKSGCKWFIIEQDTCPGDPFDSLEISFNYVREKLIK